jgi:hypothetical protein
MPNKLRSIAYPAAQETSRAHLASASSATPPPQKTPGWLVVMNFLRLAGRRMAPFRERFADRYIYPGIAG